MIPDPEPATPPRRAIENLPVYRAEAFYVSSGVAEGDPVTFADELVLDDIYQLRASARSERLLLTLGPKGRHFRVAPGSAVGAEGRIVHLDCCLTLMGFDGQTCEALVLVEVEDGVAEAIYLLPLAPLHPEADYRLVGIDRQAATTRFAEAACVAFVKGTRITLASGEQRPVEALRVGDRVLTRDDGPREIRWIGRQTLRATGAFAPVAIRKGALNNEEDLIVSPDARVFVWQREDRLGAGRSEVLVRVRHLINGETVVQLEGGFVDYFQLLFDEHEIVYAEGIATESMLVDYRTQAALPREEAEGSPVHRHRPHLDYEVAETLVAKPDAVDLLRRASSS